MSRHWILIVIFVLFLLESTLFPWLIPAEWTAYIRIHPHLVLIGIVLIGVFYGRHYALVTGIAFGLLHDLLFYGYMIGLYMAGYGLLAYFAGLFFFRVRPSLMTVQSAVVLSVVAFELFLYGIYSLFNIFQESFAFALARYMLPSVAANILLSLVLYIPLRQCFEWFLKRDKNDDG